MYSIYYGDLLDQMMMKLHYMRKLVILLIVILLRIYLSYKQ